MLQKKCTEMAKLADNEVMARGHVEKRMEETQKEKEELESDNIQLVSQYQNMSAQQ